MINELGDESVFPILEKHIEDKSYGIRILVEKGMGNIGIKKAVPVLIKRYTKLKKIMIFKSQDDSNYYLELTELMNINKALAMIGGNIAEKHIVEEMTRKTFKTEVKEFDELMSTTQMSFINFAAPKYYKVYKSIWETQKTVKTKAWALLLLKIMEVANNCKDSIACYAAYFDEEKSLVKEEGLKTLAKELGGQNILEVLPILRREKAAYSLGNFNTDEAKKILLEKVLFDKNPRVRIAGTHSLKKILTKSDIFALEKVIKKAKNKSYLKKSMSLYYKLLNNLKNK